MAYNCPDALPRRRLEIVGTRGQLVALDTMGQDPGGTVLLTDGTGGAEHPFAVADADRPPFVAQVLAFGEALRRGDRDAFSVTRDLQTMRLLARAYGDASPTAGAPQRARPGARRPEPVEP